MASLHTKILAAEFEVRLISPDDLVNVMAKFKNSNGFGADGISSFFLKIGMPVFALVLCDIFNWSLTSGTFPQNWGIARVSPIYKDGNQWRSVTSATGYSIISFLGAAGCGFLSLGINMLKHIESFSRWKKLGSRRNLIVLVEKRWNILINKHIIQ